MMEVVQSAPSMSSAPTRRRAAPSRRAPRRDFLVSSPTGRSCSHRILRDPLPLAQLMSLKHRAVAVALAVAVAVAGRSSSSAQELVDDCAGASERLTAEHRVRAHRRPRPRVVHRDIRRCSRCSTTCSRRTGHDLRQLLRSPIRLCCPSRSSILRGQYVHNHGVRTNLPPNGGFERWHQLGDDTSTVATWLHDAGYRTALFGKYLNGYPDTVAPTYVPPGWDDWASPNAGNPYAEYNYTLNENGTLEHYGHEADVTTSSTCSRRSRSDFIATRSREAAVLPLRRAVRAAPTGDTRAAPRQRVSRARKHRDAPSFDQADVSARAARGVRDRPHLTAAQIRDIDQLYRRRARSMLVGRGHAPDDRRHAHAHRPARQHLHRVHVRQRLPPRPAPAAGRQADAVRGGHPRAARRARSRRARGQHDRAGWHREIDLAPTFAALGGAHPADFVDGVSLVPALHSGSGAEGFRREVAARRAHRTLRRAVGGRRTEGGRPGRTDRVGRRDDRLPRGTHRSRRRRQSTARTHTDTRPTRERRRYPGLPRAGARTDTCTRNTGPGASAVRPAPRSVRAPQHRQDGGSSARPEVGGSVAPTRACHAASCRT